MIARKYQTTQPPQLRILEAAATTPPGFDSWYAVVKIAGEPRIVLIDDIADRTGFTYVKCILMLSGNVVWVEESNLLMWVWPPAQLPKPCPIRLYDYVRLTSGKRAFILDIQGDLIRVVTEDEHVLQLARWDIVRVINGGSR